MLFYLDLYLNVFECISSIIRSFEMCILLVFKTSPNLKFYFFVFVFWGLKRPKLYTSQVNKMCYYYYYRAPLLSLRG